MEIYRSKDLDSSIGKLQIKVIKLKRRQDQSIEFRNVNPRSDCYNKIVVTLRDREGPVI